MAPDEDIDTSGIPELGASFFAGAILTRPGESLIDKVRSARRNSGRTMARAANRSYSATKSGPGRKHRGGKPGHRIAKPRPLRAFQALLNAWAAKRVPNWNGDRDDDGKPFTVVGRNPRRAWLAGISAQRGY